MLCLAIVEVNHLKDIKYHYSDGTGEVDIEYAHVERNFTSTDMIQTLYSKISYKSDGFDWEAVLPTVQIPYHDPSMGFLLKGKLFSALGQYQRAQGVSIVDDSEVSVVAERNRFSVRLVQQGIMVECVRYGRKAKIPLGVFLKAFSELPYEAILSKIDYKPLPLLNSFPSEITRPRADLGVSPVFGITSNEQPTVKECVDFVYNTLMTLSKRPNISQASADSEVTAPYKLRFIRAQVRSMDFRNLRTSEYTISLPSMAYGCTVDEDYSLDIFEPDGVTVTKYSLARNTVLSNDDILNLRKYNVTSLRVRTNQPFILQDIAPCVFRAKGYLLADDICGYSAYDYIDDAMLEVINKSDLQYLNVITPSGRKVLSRGGSDLSVEDFLAIANYLLIAPKQNTTDSTQYDVGNRVIVSYDKQVRNTIMSTYQLIATCICGSDITTIESALPQLPDHSLLDYLRDFSNKEISQAELTNIMSRAINEGKSSALIDDTPSQMMYIQIGQTGRLDALHAPDSVKVGAIQHLTLVARINPDTNEVETPYEVIKDGKPTGIIEYVSASQERYRRVAPWDTPLTPEEEAEFKSAQFPDDDKEFVYARCDGTVVTVPRNRLDYREVSPFQDMSISRAVIPFAEFSQPKRSQMGAKMNGQALPLIFPERPLVSTGVDTKIPCLYYTVRDILTQLHVPIIDGEKMRIIEHKSEMRSITLFLEYAGRVYQWQMPCTITDKKSLYHYNVNPIKDYTYDIDDIVCYNHSCDLRKYDIWERANQGRMKYFDDSSAPSMALGTNLYIGFKTFGTSTIDDAVAISSRLVSDHKLSTIQIRKYYYELKAGESFVLTEATAPLYSCVYAGEPVITVERTTEKGIRKIHIKAFQDGEVVFTKCIPDSTKRSAGMAEVWVATYHDTEVGDKIAGRYGNKSVIARIIPEDEMPYDPETGRSLDICFSPLGLPSRQNLGQIVEVALGAVMHKEHKAAVVTPFYPNIKDDVKEEYEKAGLSPKRLYLPIYGKFTERPVMTGYMYILKLEQIANTKFSATGMPTSTDPVYGQPVKSLTSNKGQRIGEYETWALFAAGAMNIAEDLFSWYSGDKRLRDRFFDILKSNDIQHWDESLGNVRDFVETTSPNAKATEAILYSYDIELVVDEDTDTYHMFPIDFGTLVMPTISFTAHGKETTISSDSKDTWHKVELKAPVVHPFWLTKFPMGLIIGYYNPESILSGKVYYNPSNNTFWKIADLDEWQRQSMYTGMDAIIYILKHLDINKVIYKLSNGTVSIDDTSDDFDANVVQFGVADLLDVSDDDNEESPDERTQQNESNKIADSYGDNTEDDDSNESSNESFNDLYESESQSSEEDSYFEPTELSISVARFLARLRDQGRDLTAFIMNYFPVIPKVFRPSVMRAGVEHQHSFHKLLLQIAEANTSDDIYNSIRRYLGDEESSTKNMTTIRGYFFGKGAASGKHGAVRENVLSKRVGFSGRSPITPAADVHMSPFFMGIPWRTAMVQLAPMLMIKLRLMTSSPIIAGLDDQAFIEIIESLYQYNPYILKKHIPTATESILKEFYFSLRRTIKNIVESEVMADGRVIYQGQIVDPITEDCEISAAVVGSGRQPTLHKKSIRSFFVKLVDGDAIQIHPLVCGSYNADFDGDTMYNLFLFGDSKLEACRTISIAQDIISEKDDSVTLSIYQDIVLGLYCATSYKDNSATFNGDSYFYYDNPDTLRLHLEYDTLHYYDAVLYRDVYSDRYYLSTAGRMLININIPNALTGRPFIDKHGIASKVGLSDRIPNINDLEYDDIFVNTGDRPQGRPNAIHIQKILRSLYDKIDNPRDFVMLCQSLYEIGIVASDIYSVSISLDDMGIDLKDSDGNSRPIEYFMTKPRHDVKQLSTLYDMGLITGREKTDASSRIWTLAKKEIQGHVIRSMTENSNMFYMLYSGARGKPDQFMQTVGFIGIISKTPDSDIEYPILRGYGSGLSSLDIMQASHSARISIVSTQMGTKNAGYATRQCVYMTSGLVVREDDCGVGQHTLDVEYNYGTPYIVMNGQDMPIESLLGVFVYDSEHFNEIHNVLSTNGFMVNEATIDAIIDNNIRYIIDYDENRIDIIYPKKVSSRWRRKVVNNYTSYALPYLDAEGLITDETVDWIDSVGVDTVIAYPLMEADTAMYDEAFLPVDYDVPYTDTEQLFTKPVSETSESYNLYKRLLSDGKFTQKALDYVVANHITSVTFEDGTVTPIKYKLTSLFRELCLGRIGIGLPYLKDGEFITEKTLDTVEELQLKYIPVRTSLTCLSTTGVCSKCYGKKDKHFPHVGDAVGISAVQTICEPVTQTTMDVKHSGGRRAAGTALVSGLGYFRKLILATMCNKTDTDFLEKFVYEVINNNEKGESLVSEGYLTQIDANNYCLENEVGISSRPFYIQDPSRLAVPVGAYVKSGDVLLVGAPQLNKYSNSVSDADHNPNASENVFEAALKTRYLLLEQYRMIFSGLNVNPRNYELLCRAQTSQCYLGKNVNLPNVKDTATACIEYDRNYILRVSKQHETVAKFSGIANFAFERVASALTYSILNPENMKNTSCLGNLVTGTKLGDCHAEFNTPTTKVDKRSTNVVRDKYVSGSIPDDSVFLEGLLGAGPAPSVDSYLDDLLQSLSMPSDSSLLEDTATLLLGESESTDTVSDKTDVSTVSKMQL